MICKCAKPAYGNAVPIFVHHHDTQEHTQGEEEEAIEIVLDSVTYRHAKGKEKDLRNRVKGDAENDVTKRPSVIQGPEDKYELR